MGVVASVKKGLSVTSQSWPVVIFLFIVGTALNIANIFLAPQVPGQQIQVTPVAIGFGIFFMLLTIYLQSGSLGYICDKLKKDSAGLPDFFSAAGRLYVRVLGLSLLIALIVGAFVLVAALAVAFLGQKAEVVAVVIALLTASLGIYFLIMLFLAPYVLVADGKGIFASMKESSRLVRANVLKVVGLALLLIAIGFGVGILLGVVIALISSLVKGLTAQIIFAVMSSFVNSYLGLVVSGSFMAFYLGLSASSAPESQHS